MGNDGGSIPDRRDLVRSKPKAEQADKANQLRAAWFFCALSKKPLREPVVSCALGKLYNKDALLEYLLDRTTYGDGENICGHIRSLKDVKTLKLTPNTSKNSSSDITTGPAPFVCPLNLKEMNGLQPFVYILSCGCVFSQAGLKAVSSTPPRQDSDKDKDSSDSGKQFDVCPQCATKFDREEDVLLLNPSLEEREKMREAMERRRALEPAKGKGKKRKAAAAAADAEPPAKKSGPSMNPHMAAASKAIASSLAEEEAKRRANMSDAVKSLYAPKDGAEKNETFMTRGTFTRYA